MSREWLYTPVQVQLPQKTMSNEITHNAVDDLLKPLLLKDLRIQCRARGLNPGGGRETLYERLKENMLKTGNTCV